MTWLIGMKLSVIDGLGACRHPSATRPTGATMLATRRSVYIAPFGVPVLPEV